MAPDDIGYLRKACSVGQVLAPITCVLIERHSHCAVTRKDLRPDDWQDIWPELVNSDQKQPLALSQQAQGAIKSEVAEVAHA